MPKGTLFIMSQNIKIFVYFLISLSVSAPFLSWLRYAPLPDWFSDASALALLGAAMCGLCLLSIDKVSVSWLELVLLVLAFSALHSSFYGYLALLFIGLALFSILLRNCLDSSDIDDLVFVFACVVTVFSLLQSLMGLLQAFKLAYLFHGFIVYDPNSNVVVGNVAQRNQYANFLFWGVLSICYLYAVEKLRVGFALLCLLPILLAQSWSGARLPLVYALLTVVLVWYWFRKGGREKELGRLAVAVSVSVLLIAVFQFWSRDIVVFLNYLGLPIDVVSGAERISDGGLAVKRRIEWTKAWLIFSQYPWFGLGWGGFAAEATKMELTAGLPKFSESWLFTHSHNLFFQILAESGLVGALPVALGIVFCIALFLWRAKRKAEYFWLFGVFMVLLTHSMFEYPLWYMPFLIMFVSICALIDNGGGRVFLFRPVFLKVFSCVFGLGFILYFVVGLFSFFVIVRNNFPVIDVKENVSRLQQLSSAGKNPFFAREVDLVIGNYMLPSREQLDLKLAHFNSLASYRPYPNVLIKLSVFQSLSGRESEGLQSLKIAIASYPDHVKEFSEMLARVPEPHVAPLREVALTAAQAYAKYPAYSQAAQQAAVMTVAAPVTRKTLF
ncbi:O-antigen ligase C-terminal domain-containing protein [Chromobacterium alkanivorans]|uniref:Wzy polymerase domain-containing protein n=1 Tax=Chromobacterium alkanivorans TaxID=1071719 RepID=UPI0019674803|nr:O-antigen ligase C-terminal domain-containing protein [Chromobacterium alkanivorans]